jgi:hypothetical protein
MPNLLETFVKQIEMEKLRGTRLPFRKAQLESEISKTREPRAAGEREDGNSGAQCEFLREPNKRSEHTGGVKRNAL